MAPTTHSPAADKRLPPAIWILGFVSLLMDISSELIHSLLPVFLTGTLGISVLIVGMIEGFAEASALISKVFSGVLSDALRRRKGLAVLGYALGAITKPAFALAQGVSLVIAARFVDRIGKGIRGAPRDALIADIVPAGRRGAAYGLRESLDTVGAVVGPLLATLLMVLLAGDFRSVFWIAAIPAVASVALLWLGVHEPEQSTATAATHPLRVQALRRLGSAYWLVVLFGAVFTLARFSEAFLLLRAAQVGVPPALIPLVMVVMGLVYAASAYPFGRWADTASHALLLLTLDPIQYRSEVETSGSFDIAVAACRQQRRANSAGVAHSSAEWGRLSL